MLRRRRAEKLAFAQKVAEFAATVEEAIELVSFPVNTVDTEPFAALMRPVWDQFITTPAQQDIVRRIRDMREG